jgi:hypothetical protein
MSAKNAIEKLYKTTKEKESQNSEHRQRQEEEVELLKKTKVEKESKRVEREGILNIQPLAIRLPLHSSSSLECAKGKVYNEKI